MNKKSISMKTIFVISFIMLIIITNSIICFIVFSNWKASTDNIIDQMEDDASKNIINRIEHLVSIPLYINEANHNIIKNNIIDIYNKNDREIFFAGVMKSNDREVYSFSFGTENGEYYGARRNPANEIEIMRSDAGTNGNSRYYTITQNLTEGEFVQEFGKFDPRTRDWYKIAKLRGEPTFSPIYEHFVMNDLALSASYPIYDIEGNLKGVLGTHIILSKINDYLEEIISDKEAIAYIIENNTGTLVANSLGEPNFITLEDKKIERIAIEDIENEYIKEAYLNYRQDLESKQIIKTENDSIHISFTQFAHSGLNWLIITAIPESQFMNEITRNIIISLILTISALILSIIMYIKNQNIFFKPIYDLIDATEKFSSGDFNHRTKITKNDEIGKIAVAFNKMAEQLYILINNLEEKVKERTLELEKTNIALNESEGNLRLILNSTAEAIYGIDTNGICTFCNESCLRLLRYKKDTDLIGKNMHLQIHYQYADGTPITIKECKVINALIKGEGAHVNDEVFWRSDGTCFQVEYFSYPQYRDGEIVGAVVTFMDITERKKSEEEILYLSYHDQLTGLYNRRYFENKLEQLDEEDNYPLAIIMGDVNGLKLVNDSLGHEKGDQLLKKAAKVIQNGCRKRDIIARLGGDEFVIILTNVVDEEVEVIINRMKELASKEIVGSVNLSISFGYGIKFHEHEKVEDILKTAEDNMYKIKLIESSSMRCKTINAIMSTLYEKNYREESHSKRVSDLCIKLGATIGLSREEIESLNTIGLHHDIGYIAIEENILRKAGKLTDYEWEQIKRHPEIGYRILNTVNEIANVAKYVLAHHERWDGSGYPKGLHGEEIPLLSRILTIVDAYDSMTNERTYKRALSKEEAIDELKRNAGLQFDPSITKIFIESILKNKYN